MRVSEMTDSEVRQELVKLIDAVNTYADKSDMERWEWWIEHLEGYDHYTDLPQP